MSLNQHRGSLVRALVAGRRWAFAFGTAGLLFAGQHAQAEEHSFICVCPGCASAAGAGSGGSDDSVVSGIQFFGGSNARWTSTATDGATGSRGDAITLTYGVVLDGTSIGGAPLASSDPEVAGEEVTDTSNLRAFLNNNVGTEAQWMALIDDAYQRWGEVSGLTMVRENADDGAAMGSGGAAGSLGVRADMRIGGRFLDGQSGSNVLAYNYSPSNGDHVVDTSNTSFYSNASNNYRGFRNVFMHESGHGLGLAHTIPTNGTKLMEPFINTGFDGPQFDDILAVQRQYGDAREANGGNDTTGTATSLGSLAPLGVTPATVSIGTDASDSSPAVGADDIDFVSIDGTSDIDVFGFTLTALADLTIFLDPKGPTYQEGPQFGTATAFNAKALNDLKLEFLDASGAVLDTADLNVAGSGETIVANGLGPGDYFARVSVGSGDVDQIQMYDLEISAVLVPEPSTLYAFAAVSFLLMRRRRRMA